SIGVTIIATGLNVEQQDEISNSETKKVIHSLVDERELSPKEKEQVIIAPVIELETKKETPEVRHTLDVEVDEELVQPDTKKQEINPKQEYFIRDINLIPTTDIIKNIKVVYEEVKANIKEDDDFIIKPVTKMSNKAKEVEVEEEQQITLTFDLPLSNA